MERSRKVENGPIMKLVRTLSYLLILVSGAILSIILVKNINLGIVQNFKIINTLHDFVNTELDFMSDYLWFTLLIGFITLLWTQSNSVAKRVVFTAVVLVGALIFDNLYFNQMIIPFLPALTFINDLLGTLDSNHNWFYLLVLIPLLFLYIAFATKRPKRIATQLVSNGLMLLIFAIIFNQLPVLIGNDWNNNIWFGRVDDIMHSISFALITLGSAFGVLGMFRK